MAPELGLWTSMNIHVQLITSKFTCVRTSTWLRVGKWPRVKISKTPKERISKFLWVRISKFSSVRISKFSWMRTSKSLRVELVSFPG